MDSRKQFEEELERLKWDSDYGGYDETTKVFQAFDTVIRSLTERSEPVAAERERCAGMAEDLAAMMENGAGECNPGERLRQCARNIRQAEKKPLGIAKFYPNSDTLASSPSGKPGGER